jgi:hypothetical protein
VLDENLFRYIGDHQVVFGNQDLEHTVLRPGDYLQSPRKKDPERAGLGTYPRRCSSKAQPSTQSERQVVQPVKKSLCNFDHITKIVAGLSLRRSTIIIDQASSASMCKVWVPASTLTTNVKRIGRP